MWSITAKLSDVKFFCPLDGKKPAPDLKAGFFMGEADFRWMNLLDDGQVNHRLVEQLVANSPKVIGPVICPVRLPSRSE